MPLTFLMLLIPGAGAPAVRSIRILSIQSIGGGTPTSKASNVSNGTFRARFLV